MYLYYDLIVLFCCWNQAYLSSLIVGEDLAMHKSLSASRALKIEELERRLNESEVLRKEASEMAIDFEKDLTLALEERDKAYAEVGAVSGENADLILKNASLTVKNADLEKALNEAISERDKAHDISNQITAREQNTAEE